VVNSLKSSVIAHNLTDAQIQLLDSIVRLRSFQTGEIILHEYTFGTELFVILDGSAEVILPTQNPLTLMRLSNGRLFGEFAYIDEGARSAQVIARSDNTLIAEIPRATLDLLADTYPQLGYRLFFNINCELASKLRSTNTILLDLKTRSD
jgi:CRP-like cAMP-binding protein